LNLSRSTIIAVVLIAIVVSSGFVSIVHANTSNSQRLISILTLAVVIHGYNEHWIPLSDQELASILTTNYVDEADWTSEETPEELKEPRVNLPQVNISMLSLGTREGYHYLKVDFEGTITWQAPQTEDGDQLLLWTLSIMIDVDNNAETGWHGADVLVGAYVEYTALFKEFEPAMLYNIPNLPEEDEAMHQASSTPLRYKGGPGYSYVILEVPMNLAGLSPGQTVIVDLHAEVESQNFHHYSFDALTASNATYSGDHPLGHVQQITIP